MRLISCHIENFGKLQNLDLTFPEGIAVLCRDNGWGKSTLAVFICSMFYGLGGDRKRNIEENDRKHYMPWQGGNFGGSLVFELGDARYEVTRFFGDKESRDIFELMDLRSRLASRNYTEKLGEEVFGIDRESFLRTVCILQNQCRTQANGDIHARISRVTEEAQDMGGYEEAMAGLNRAIAALNPNRATGSISQRREEMLGLEQVIDGSSQAAEQIEKTRDQLKEAREDYARLLAQRDTVQQQMDRLAREGGRSVRCKELQKYQIHLASCEEEVRRCRSMLPGVIPSKEEIERQLGLCGPMEICLERYRNYALSDELSLELMKGKERFERGIPSEADISAWVDRLRMAEKEEQETSRHGHEGRLGSWDMIPGKPNDTIQEGIPLGTMTGVILGIFFILIGIIWLGVGSIPTGLCLILLGGGIVAVSILYRYASSRAENNGAERAEPPISEGGQAKRAEDGAPEVVKTQIRDYLRRYHGDAEAEDLHGALYRLQQDAARYLQLRNREETGRKAQEEYRGYRRQIDDFLTACKLVPEHSLQKQLLHLRDLVDDYQDAMGMEKQARARLLEFDKDDSGGEQEEAGQTPQKTYASVEEAGIRMRGILRELEQCHSRMLTAGQRLEALQQEYDDREENIGRLRQLKQLQESEERRYRLLVRTRDSLEKAREQMVSRYAETIQNNFSSYYEFLTGEDKDICRTDANTMVSVKEGGLWHRAEVLSTGYQDLIGFCLRVALVDAMFDQEKPVLILDDPFANLDDSKTEAAFRLLQKIAGSYQILYFTCSNSRKLC